jgi:putative acetyltransferase
MPVLMLGNQGDERVWPAKRAVNSCLVRLADGIQHRVVIGPGHQVRHRGLAAVPRDVRHRGVVCLGGEVDAHGQHPTRVEPDRIDSGAVAAGVIALDDPSAADVRGLIAQHLAFASEHTPPEDVHALDVDGLLDAAITFFSYRLEGQVLAVGALRQLDADHGELKCMHTARTARGRGIGMAMLQHLIGVARDRTLRRLSLETGSMTAFEPARALYARAGFVACGPFGGYTESLNRTFMTLDLDR